MKVQKGILAILIGSSILLTSCKCERKVDGAAVAVDGTENTDVNAGNDLTGTSAKIDADGNYIYDLGSNIDLNLPDGSVMNVGEKSSEKKLFTMLSDANFQVSDDKTQGWVTLDRVYFPTGKSELSSNSQAQISNIVTLLKLFPSATVKVGGYTDNTGDAAVNKQVSTERAKSVADQLIAGGVEASRIESEGYGAEHFVCPANDSDECRAQNRRVDVRITKK